MVVAAVTRRLGSQTFLGALGVLGGKLFVIPNTVSAGRLPAEPCIIQARIEYTAADQSAEALGAALDGAGVEVAGGGRDSAGRHERRA